MIAKKICLLFIVILSGTTSLSAQSSDAQEKERERFVQKQYEEYQKRVDTYLALLELDDFNSQILKQKIEDFYKTRSQIAMSGVPDVEKESLMEQLTITHFNDVQELYTPETLASVRKFVKDNKAEIKRLQKTRNTKKPN